jgi:hypothetical protein
MKNSTPEKIADKWIRQMQKSNFTPDQMLECLKLAREKYEVMVYTKNRYQEFHKIATATTFVDDLININRTIEKERFNKIMEKTFPIISGNGILNSIYDVSDKKLIDGIDFVTSFKDYKKENFYFYSPEKEFDSREILGRVYFTKDFFIEASRNTEVHKAIKEIPNEFWKFYSDFAIENFMLCDQKFVFAGNFNSDYKKVAKGFIFRHCYNTNIEFWLYNPQLTGVNETRAFSAKELIEMQTSKIYAYSSIKK